MMMMIEKHNDDYDMMKMKWLTLNDIVYDDYDDSCWLLLLCLLLSLFVWHLIRDKFRMMSIKKTWLCWKDWLIDSLFTPVVNNVIIWILFHFLRFAQKKEKFKDLRQSSTTCCMIIIITRTCHNVNFKCHIMMKKILVLIFLFQQNKIVTLNFVETWRLTKCEMFDLYRII